MKNLRTLLQNARKEKQLKMKELAVRTGIDQALISKFENGKRLPTESQLSILVQCYELSEEEVRPLWLAEKLYEIVRDDPYALEALAVAESRIEYLRGEKVLSLQNVPDQLKEQLVRIDELKEAWQAHKPLNATQLKKMREYFNIEYTFESNRIEGNTLSLQETQLVVNEGLTIGGKSMQEHLEAINHSEAIQFLEELARLHAPISRKNLLDLHALILKSIDKDNAGKYRSVPVRISGSKHEPPQPYLLDKLMEDYYRYYQEYRYRLHPILLAAEMHERLVSIHPFIDGNGRTSRLIMNLVLLQHGYTIANLKGDTASRLAYYQALESVQINNDPGPFYQLVVDAVEESLKNHLALV